MQTGSPSLSTYACLGDGVPAQWRKQALEEVQGLVAWRSESGWAAVTADDDYYSWVLEGLDADFFSASDDGPAGGPAGRRGSGRRRAGGVPAGLCRRLLQ